MQIHSSFCLKNAHVIDVERGLVLADKSIVVLDGSIAEIGHASDNTKTLPTFDVAGQFVIPGLIDCHCHIMQGTSDLAAQTVLSPQYVMAKAYDIMKGMLMRGFTTVRDCGGADFGVARAVEEGLVTGPRIIYCGKALSQTGGHGDYRPAGGYSEEYSYWSPSISRVVDGVTGIRKAARDEIRKGAHHLKIMAGGGIASPTDRIDSDQFSIEEIEAVVEEALMANIYVTAHAYCPRTIIRAVKSGVRSLEHCTIADDNALNAIKENDAFMVPTLIIFKALAEDGVKDGLPKELVAKIGSSLNTGIAAVERAHQLGVRMAYGSDLIGTMHARQLEEFELRADVVPAADLLRTATLNGAQLINRDKDLGKIEPGFRADLLVVDRNPLENIRVLTDPDNRLKAIVKDGIFVKSTLEAL